MEKDGITRIAEAIEKDSRGDRKFAYGLLVLFAIVSVTLGGTMWHLITTMSGNMESMAQNMQTMSKDMSEMNRNMAVMSRGVTNMDYSTQSMNYNVQGMNKGMGMMNRMNPMSYFGW